MGRRGERRGLVVNLLEKDAAHVGSKLFNKILIFFSNELNISRFVFMTSAQFPLAFAENNFSQSCDFCCHDLTSLHSWFYKSKIVAILLTGSLSISELKRGI